MVKFLVFPSPSGRPVDDLLGAHLLGADGVPIRGEIKRAEPNEVCCSARTPDPFALSLLWSVDGFGAVQLETTRLPDREQPYLLNLELARHRLMRISLKREEWGLYDYHGTEQISRQIDEARDLFVEALSHSEDPKAAAKLADQSLRVSLQAAEDLSSFHASVFLGRRQQGSGIKRDFLGAAVSLQHSTAALLPEVRELLGFIRVPFTWRDIQPKEQSVDYAQLDAWFKAAKQAKMALHGGPLLNFRIRAVPDWMYIWENDFDTILEYAREHVQRSVNRYAKSVSSWIVASGLHADNVFSLNFEQIMELSRVAASIVRDRAPRAQVVLGLTQPWGEYAARNQRTIPPLLYADMAVQSGIPFDAFGLQFLFGIGSDGYHLRDLLQISALIDKLANLGKPLHITGVGVPSATTNGNGPGATGGAWREPWSEQSQAGWLVEFCEVALSKPYVESVCVQSLVNDEDSPVPSGGLLRNDLTAKPALANLRDMVQRLQSGSA